MRSPTNSFEASSRFDIDMHTPLARVVREYRHGDSNPGFRRERAAS